LSILAYFPLEIQYVGHYTKYLFIVIDFRAVDNAT
jgi:hypothetical protein